MDLLLAPTPPLSQKTSLSKEELTDRIKGCIYGAALGDAFGLSTEFMSKVTAKHLYGVGPIKFGRAEGFEFWRDGHRSRWHENDFTDDTDQLLLILQCLLADGGELNPVHFAYRLEEWSRIGFPELGKPPCGIGFTVGSVMSHPKFLQNPHAAAYEVWDRKGRNLAANGAVMRTAVLGIPFFWDELQVSTNAIKAAKVTHADPRSVTSAIIVSVIISRILSGGVDRAPSDVRGWQEQLTRSGSSGTEFDAGSVEVETENLPRLEPKQLPSSSRSDGFLSKISNLFQRKRGGGPPKFEFPQFQPYDKVRGDTPATLPDPLPRGMDTLGPNPVMHSICARVVDDYAFLLTARLGTNEPDESDANWSEELLSHSFPESLSDLKLDEREAMGYTFKCLGAGIYAASRAKGDDESDSEFFKSIITELTLEGGDADTNCAVAGAVLGCRLGKSRLPSDWLEGLRNADFLEGLADELCSLVFK